MYQPQKPAHDSVGAGAAWGGVGAFMAARSWGLCSMIAHSRHGTRATRAAIKALPPTSLPPPPLRNKVSPAYLSLMRIGRPLLALRCHYDGGHHVCVNGTMVLICSWSCEYHHEGLIHGDIVGRVESTRVTRDRMGSITGVGPDDFSSRLDG